MGEFTLLFMRVLIFVFCLEATFDYTRWWVQTARLRQSIRKLVWVIVGFAGAMLLFAAYGLLIGGRHLALYITLDIVLAAAAMVAVWVYLEMHYQMSRWRIAGQMMLRVVVALTVAVALWYFGK